MLTTRTNRQCPFRHDRPGDSRRAMEQYLAGIPVKPCVEGRRSWSVVRSIEQRERVWFESVSALEPFDANDERRVCPNGMMLTSADDDRPAGVQLAFAEMQEVACLPVVLNAAQSEFQFRDEPGQFGKRHPMQVMRPCTVPERALIIRLVIGQPDRIVKLAEERERHRDAMHSTAAVPVPLPAEERMPRAGQK